MKKSFIIILLISVSVALPALAAYFILSAPKGPRIEFLQSTIHDFGVIDEGQLIEYDFPFRNSGDRVLEITRVVPGCACTGTQVESKIIPPKGKSKVTVRYKARRVLQQEMLPVVLTTNDPERPAVRVMLKGYVQPDVFWYPRSASFYRRQSGEMQYKDIQFLRRKSQQLEVTEVTTSSDKITASVEPNEKGIRCRVLLIPDCPAGFWLEHLNVTLRTKKGIDRVAIPVHLMVVQ